MTVTKSKDGIPAWDGTPSTWSEYRRAAYMYEETVKWESRYLCGPRLAAELTGAARTAIANKKRGWLSSQDGVGKLLRCLKETMSEPALPEISNQLDLLQAAAAPPRRIHGVVLCETPGRVRTDLQSPDSRDARTKVTS